MRTLKNIWLGLLTCATISTQAQEVHSTNIGLIYPLSTNGVDAKEYTNDFSLNILGGVSKSETGFCGAGIFNAVTQDSKGFIGAGMVNYIGGNSKGVIASGFTNINKGNVDGLQAAGFVNYAAYVKGLQAAGYINYTKGVVDGIQASGFLNVAGSAYAQFSGFINVAHEIRGIQASSFINVTQHIRGVQAASFINVAENVKGVQVSGFINVAKKVSGLQIGFINIADSCDQAIGIVNISKNGEMALGYQQDDMGIQMLTFRSGGKRWYGLVGIGAKPYHNDFYVASELGIGMHTPLSKHFRINTEAAFTTLSKDYEDDTYYKSTFRIFPSFRFWNIECYGGVAFSYGILSMGGDHRLLPDNSYQWKNSLGTNATNVGYVVGIQYHL